MTLTVGTIKNIGKTYANIMGKQHIIETAVPKIRGVNPSIKYSLGNNNFSLDRFCSAEMQQARALNKIAIKQAKKSIKLKFSKASKEDFKRLTSDKPEDVYSRVVWTNPADGKVYNLLKQGETTDGSVLIKILDKDGAFVKDAVVKPKTVTIVDVFDDNSILNMPHGFVVESFAKRYNPFARYDKISVSQDNWFDIKNKLSQHFKKAGASDYVSMSLGSELLVEEQSKVAFSVIKDALSAYKNDDMVGLCEVLRQYINKNTRVLIAAGNNGRTSFNDFLVKISGAEGVGSLSPKTGKISPFSASRNSFYTQHYEVGEVPVKKVFKNGKLYGLSFTGQNGCDVLVSKFKDLVEKPWRLKQKLLKIKEHKMTDINNQIKYFKDQESILLNMGASEKTITPFGSLAKTVDLSSSNYETILSDIQKQLFKLRCKSNKLDFDIKALNTERVDAKEILSNFYGGTLRGTSFSTPIRVAKLSLNDMMNGVL